jgi:hypothetical protein
MVNATLTRTHERPTVDNPELSFRLYREGILGQESAKAAPLTGGKRS